MTATCRTCGATFEPAPELLERFPGWKPRECPDCYRKASRGSGGRSSRARSRKRAADDPGPSSGVFTDGSATPNPGPGGWGAVRVRDDEVIAEASGADPDTTNNRMELVALHEGAKLVPEGEPEVIYSDSNLVVRTVNEWAAGWARRGWRRKSGPVENLDLVRPLFEYLQSRPELEVRWIRAHVGYRWNEYADELARTAGERATR